MKAVATSLLRGALLALSLASPVLAQDDEPVDPYAPGGEALPLPPVRLEEEPVPAQPTDERPFYVAVGYGFSDLGVGRNELAADLTDATGVTASVDSLDTTHSGVRLQAGYWFHRRLAAELGFVDLGDVRSRISFAGPPGSEMAIEQGIRDVHPFLGSGVTAGLRGLIFDGEKFDVTGKVGALFWEADNEFRVEYNGTPLDFREEDDGTDLMLGLGAHYSFDPAWAVQLEVDHFGVDDEDALVVTLGVRYSF